MKFKANDKAVLVTPQEDLNEIMGKLKYHEEHGYEYIESAQPEDYSDKVSRLDVVTIEKADRSGYDIVIDRTGFKMHFLDNDLKEYSMTTERDPHTIKFKPFDFVKAEDGSVGIIIEVNYNTCQEPPTVSYAVEWIDSKQRNPKIAWWDNWELSPCSKNLFEMFAKMTTNAMGSSDRYYPKLFGFTKM